MRKGFLLRAELSAAKRGGTFARARYGGTLSLAEAKELDTEAIRRQIGAVWVKAHDRDRNMGMEVFISAIFKEPLVQMQAEKKEAEREYEASRKIACVPYVYDEKGRMQIIWPLPEGGLPEKYGVAVAYRGTIGALPKRLRGDHWTLMSNDGGWYTPCLGSHTHCHGRFIAAEEEWRYVKKKDFFTKVPLGEFIRDDYADFGPENWDE